METTKSKIVKAIVFICKDCHYFNIQEPLWAEETDDTGYCVNVDYMPCVNCETINRVAVTPDEWRKKI